MEWLVFGGILFVIITAILKPRRCDVCNTGFKRKYFTWEIEGKKQHLCPNCNSRMTKRQSAQKFKDRFG